MSSLDKIFIGVLSLAILCVVLSIVYFVAGILTATKGNELKNKKPKNKKSCRKLKKRIQLLTKKRRKQINTGILLLICGMLSVGIGMYVRYYQATNLGDRDSDGIVEGYYLLNQINLQLEEIAQTPSLEKSRNNIRDLAAKLSSFGMRSADPKITVEGQRLLNRYYSQIKELGLNLNNQSVERLQEEQVYDIYMSDIEKSKDSQKKVFDYFKVDESALQQKK